jgi:protein-L-isoaspartate(D-aspartate) O-methyltransferase
LDEDYKPEAYEDYAIPIGFGQSTTQPTTVAFMLELLDAQEGERVLNIGAGTGYTTALLGHMVGSEGLVYGVEAIPELVKKAQKNIEKYNLGQIHIVPVTEKNMLFDLPPFNRILVNADTKDIPEELIAMLEQDGVMVLPVEGTIFKLVKTDLGITEVSRYEGFSFAPYINL